MVSEHLTTIVRLRGLLDVTRAIRRGDDLPTLLDGISATVSETLGWATVAITLHRPASDDFLVETVHGSAAAREALLGRTRTHETYSLILTERFERRGAYFIPHGEFDWGGNGLTLWVPEIDAKEGDWHAEDALLIPLRDGRGELLGLMSVDEPVSGRRPSDEEIDVLVAVGEHVALAIDGARAAAEAARHRLALERLLQISSHLTETPGEGLLDVVCDAIATTLEFGRVAVFLEGRDGFIPRASAGWAVGDPQLALPASRATLERIFSSPHETNGCFLLTSEQAHALVAPEERSPFWPQRNGSSPRGWQCHWLLVPLAGPGGELRGFVWVDDPVDMLVPSPQRLQALRLFADQAAAALATAEQLRAMQESEARKSAILESALDCVVTIDHDARIVEFNPEAEETFGWTSDEAIGRELAEILVAPGRDGRRLADYLSTGMAVIAGKRLEVVAVRSNGRQFPVELAVSKVRMPGSPLYTATIRDISARRRAEDRLREAETRYRNLVEQMPLVAYVNTLDREPIRTTYMSPQVETLLGYPRSDWLEDDMFARALHPSDRDRVLAEVREWRARGGRFRSEYRLMAADGRTVWVLDETVRVEDEDGTPLFLQGFWLDITERRTAEEAKRQSETLYRHVVESSLDPITLVDLTGRILYASPAAERTFGYTADQLIGRGLDELIHPEDIDGVRDHMRSVVDGRTGQTTMTRLKHADGRWITIEGAGSPVIDESGEATMVLAVARDVTERHRLEDELRQAQKMEAVGNLAGGIAHDFNNLLTAISGYSEFIVGDDEASESVRRSAQQIARAADSAGALTRQLLAFSRKQILQPRVLDLNEVVTSVEKMLGRVIGEHITLQTSLDADLGHVKADPGQIEQVILNLAVNARDAMPGGGTIVVETRNAEVDEAAARQHVGLEQGAYVVLSVSDTGVGLDPETAERVFEPFFTTKPVGEGTGLGLSTAYGIVTQSGGHIGVYSEPGHGATFKIYLPRVVEEAPVEPVSLPAQVEGGSETILLVEDEQIVRAIATEILQRAGYRVLAAAAPDEALDIVERQPGSIDLLLTDVVMPVMGGRDLALRVCALRPGIKVLYTSGYTDAAIVHHGVLGEGPAFLQKPFTRKVLLRRVREALDGASTAERALAVAP